MPLILTIHLYVGLLVVLAALGLAWSYTLRRVVLYILTLQIILGAYVLRTGLHPPPAHWILALVAWGLYMGANALAKRRPQSRLPLAGAAVASLLVIITYGIGQHALMYP